MDGPPREIRRFGWREASERIDLWSGEFDFDPATRGGRFPGRERSSGSPVELEVPLVLGRPHEGTTLATWRTEAEASPGLHVVLLVQAGAVAAGLWRDDDLLDHKAWKRYVVRGRGKAQPTYLKTKGRSRAGSRLRLRNAEALREDLGARLVAWWTGYGPPRALFVSCPVREWPELFGAAPDLPFGPRDERIVRIPLDVGVPNHAELLRVRGFLGRGRLRIYEDGSVTPSP